MPDGKKKRVHKHPSNLLSKTVVAEREKAKREGTHRTGMTINGGHDEEKLSKAKELYPREFQQEKQREERTRNAGQCRHCEGIGHSTRWSKSCGEHLTCLVQLAKRKKPPQQNDNAEPLHDVANDAVDTPEAKTARDSSECDILDDIDLDGDDEFFDCIECSDLNSNNKDCEFDASSDKENCNECTATLASTCVDDAGVLMCVFSI